MTKLTIFCCNSQCKQYYNVWLTDWGGAYNRNRGVYGFESINPPQPGAANLIVRPNQKQKKTHKRRIVQQAP